MSFKVVTSSIMCESALGYYAQFLIGDGCGHGIIPVGNVSDDTVTDSIYDANHVVLFGTYWSDEFVERLTQRGCKVYNIKFDVPPFDEIANIIMAYDPRTNNFVKTLQRHMSALLNDLNDRVRCLRTVETQPFITGICNSMMDKTDAEKFADLFSGEYEYRLIIEAGKQIVESQVQTARERAKKNSRRGQFSTGVDYVVTDAPEFVNITHDELKKEFPDVKVTVIASLKFANGKSDQVAHSLRSWDADINVKEMVGPNGGGGIMAAGIRFDIDVGINY